MDTFSVKLSNMAGRLDASYHVPIVDAITAHLQKYAEEVTPVGDKRISKEVILPMRFKRVYVDEGHGRVLFGGKQLYELDPSGKKYLSVTKHWYFALGFPLLAAAQLALFFVIGS